MSGKDKVLLSLWVTCEQRDQITDRAEKLGMQIGTYLYAVTLATLASSEFSQAFPEFKIATKSELQLPNQQNKKPSICITTAGGFN